MSLCKEIHYEGWLIKSPPTKRIWRARWRRRWFTLKQGEIPEQFCLEYYTDRNCRKLKGVIDLDQCEQVDCGLRLENRKQKFQFMFDIKTPKRTYYLAADSAEDMHDWVNCICQVCHLHDTKNSFNTGTGTDLRVLHKQNGAANNTVSQYERDQRLFYFLEQDSQTQLKCKNAYQNNKNLVYVNTDNDTQHRLGDDLVIKSTIGNDAENVGNIKDFTFAFLGNGTAIDQNTLKVTLDDTKLVPKKNNFVELLEESTKITPTLPISTGPYIPISECFSGNFKPNREINSTITPLNNLDPKFYDTPRNHDNIGLNLIIDQSYSPKITNCHTQAALREKILKSSNHRSDSDSESVFTDDEDWTNPLPLRDNIDRCTRPSDSSIENESFVLTYSQRFSRRPSDMHSKNQIKPPLVKVFKNKKNLVLDLTYNEKSSGELQQLSDTENSSPGIRDFEKSCNIPRTLQKAHYNVDQLFRKNMNSAKIVSTTSSPELIDLKSNHESTLLDTQITPSQFNNTISNNIETNVFRYDFLEVNNLPPVNRLLKPKINVKDKVSEDSVHNVISLPNGTINYMEDSNNAGNHQTSPKAIDTSSSIGSNKNKYGNGESHSIKFLSTKPPSIDRNLKPNVYKLNNCGIKDQSRQTHGTPLPLAINSEEKEVLNETLSASRQPVPNFSTTENVLRVPTIKPSSENLTLQPLACGGTHKLQYFELDVTNSPSINRQSINISNLCTQVSNRLGLASDTSPRFPVNSSVVYNSVDFVKTEAFKRIREERKKESEGINSLK